MNIGKLFLLTSFLFFCNLLYSQNCAFVAIENAISSPSEQVCVDIEIIHHTSLVGFSGVFQWDEEKLSFSELVNIHPLLDQQFLNLNETESGILRFGYLGDLFDGADLVGPAATLCFDPIGNEPFTTLVEIVSVDPTFFDIIDINVEEVDICYQAGTIQVVDNPSEPAPFSIVEEIIHTSCFSNINGAINITPFFFDSPLSFQWTGPNGFNSSLVNIDGLESGWYHLIVQDQDGTEVVKDYEVKDLTVNVLHPIVVNKNCAGGDVGEINLNLNANDGPFDIVWSNNETAAHLVELSPGTYSVSITNAHGCQAESIFEFGYEFLPIVDFQLTNASCNDAADGSIDLIVDPDLDFPISFDWSNGAATEDISNLVAGTYTVTVSDNFGCSKIIDFEVTQHEGNLDINQITYCASNGMNNGFILNSTVIGDYVWSDGSGDTGWRVDLSPGVYGLTITDPDNGCVIVEEDYTIVNIDYTQQKDYYACNLDTIVLSYDTDHSLIDSYRWYPGAEFSDSTVAYPLYFPDPFDPNAQESKESMVQLVSNTGCFFSIQFDLHDEEVCVWPGDANDDSKVDGLDLLNIALLNNEEGPSRTEMNTDWFAQPSFLWDSDIPGTTTNACIVDCDGNGIVQDLDTSVVIANYGSTHFRSLDDDEEILLSDIELSLSSVDYILAGSHNSLNIDLNHVNGNVEDVYGLNFQLTYDVSLFEPGSFTIKNEGWLAEGQSIWSFAIETEEEGVLDIVLTRSSGTGVSGAGKIATLSFITAAASIDQEFTFDLGAVKLLNDQGEFIDAIGKPLVETIWMEDPDVGTNNFKNGKNDLIIFPNPANEFITVQNLVQTKAEIHVYNSIGNLIDIHNYNGNLIPIGELSAGLYFLKVKEENGFRMGTFIKH